MNKRHVICLPAVVACLFFSMGASAEDSKRAPSAATKPAAAADVYIKIPDIDGESKPAQAPAPKPAQVAKPAKAPPKPEKPTAGTRTMKAAPAAPAAQQQGMDNSNTKTPASINSNPPDCTLKEQINDSSICKQN